MTPANRATAAEHRVLVDRLSDDLRPVRRHWSPWTPLGWWMPLAVGAVALGAAIGLRHDLAVELAQRRHVLAIALLLIGSGVVAAVALLSATPGRLDDRIARRIAVGALGLAVVAGLLGDAGHAPSIAAFVLPGLRCAVCVAAFGVAPWIALFRTVRQGAPLDGRTTGLCVGAAAFLVGAATVHLACPIDDRLHLAVWHGLPVAVWALASAAVGRAWLVRWLDEPITPAAERDAG